MLIGQQVTIVGGGIAGLTAAIALAQRGAQVTVLEQAEALREVGAGFQITPNGIVVLHALGLGQALRDIAIPGQAVNLRDGLNGRQVARIDLGQMPGPYYFLHRADLLELLADTARQAGVRIRLLQRINHVEFTPHGTRLTNAQGAQSEHGLVLGADGLHSVLYKALNGDKTPSFTGQVAWRATVPVSDPVAPEAQVYMGPRRHLVAYPLRRGTLLNIVAVEERATWVQESWSGQDDPDNLRRAFAGFAPEVQAILEKVDAVNLWGLFRHPVAQTWFNDRVAILGDAAHPTLPFMAQGANMALEDAWVMTAALSAFDTPMQAFAAYQAARRDRCRRIVAAAAANARNFHLANPLVRTLGHTALATASRVAPALLNRRFDWIYRRDVTREFA